MGGGPVALGPAANDELAARLRVRSRTFLADVPGNKIADAKLNCIGPPGKRLPQYWQTLREHRRHDIAHHDAIGERCAKREHSRSACAVVNQGWLFAVPRGRKAQRSVMRAVVADFTFVYRALNDLQCLAYILQPLLIARVKYG